MAPAHRSPATARITLEGEGLPAAPCESMLAHVSSRGLPPVLSLRYTLFPRSGTLSI